MCVGAACTVMQLCVLCLQQWRVRLRQLPADEGAVVAPAREGRREGNPSRRHHCAARRERERRVPPKAVSPHTSHDFTEQTAVCSVMSRDDAAGGTWPTARRSMKSGSCASRRRKPSDWLARRRRGGMTSACLLASLTNTLAHFQVGRGREAAAGRG